MLCGDKRWPRYFPNDTWYGTKTILEFVFWGRGRVGNTHESCSLISAKNLHWRRGGVVVGGGVQKAETEGRRMFRPCNRASVCFYICLLKCLFLPCRRRAPESDVWCHDNHVSSCRICPFVMQIHPSLTRLTDHTEVGLIFALLGFLGVFFFCSPSSRVF